MDPARLGAMRTSTLLPVLLLATGCGSVSASLKQPLADLPPGKGVAVFSTGASSKSFFSVVILALRVPTPGGSSGMGTGISMDRGWDDSDFKDEHGQVRMFILDEGTYCLVPYDPQRSVKLPEFEFRVAKGKVNYVGSIFMTSAILFQRTFTVRDQEKRDMEFALAARPELARLSIGRSPAVMLEDCKTSF